MDKTLVVLYGAASVLAIRVLLSLMADHREQYSKKLADERAAQQPEPVLSPAPPAARAASPKTAPAGNGKAAKLAG